ncbi:MAG: ABC transporter substrate-binding protein [Deltaproteobacteria bacterium]|nr:ABC transporter substrate-binding protein [Deltaproteobacteria bacterium]
MLRNTDRSSRQQIFGLILALFTGLLAGISPQTARALNAGSELVSPHPAQKRPETTGNPVRRKPRPEREKTWDIGIYLPASGAYADIGRHFRAGIELARNLTTKPGYAWKLHFIDSQTIPPTTAVSRFLRQRVKIILGPLRRRTARETARCCAREKIPVILWSPQPEIAAASRFVFQHFLSAADQARALSRLLCRAGEKSTALLLPDNRFGRDFAFALRRELENTAQTRIRQTVFYDPKATDFSPAILKLREPERGSPPLEPPDYPFTALVLADFYRRLRLLLPQLAFNGLVKARIYAGRSLHDPRLATECGNYFADARMVDLCAEQPRPPARVEAYRQRFEAKFPYKSSFYDLYAFDTMTLLDRARHDLERNPGPGDLPAALLGLPAMDLLSGPTRVAADGVFRKQLCPLVFSNRQYRVLRPQEREK